MNFFRRKTKRYAEQSASLPQHAGSSPDAADIQLDPSKTTADCHLPAAAPEKSKRKNYFGMGAASPAFLRRRNIAGNASCKELLTAPPATAISASAENISSSIFPDANCDATLTTLTAMDARMQRRRSIMGVSYLMKRRSIQKDLASDSVTAPPIAVVAVHPAKVPAGGRRERERQLGSVVPRRASQCSNEDGNRGSTSSRSSSSGDESSGADSDVTLATQDSADPDAAVIATSAGMNGHSQSATAPANAAPGVHAASVGSFKGDFCADGSTSDDCVDQSPQVHQSAASLSLGDKGVAGRVFYIASSEHLSLPKTEAYAKEASQQSKPGEGHKRSRTEVGPPRYSSNAVAAADASTDCDSFVDSKNYTHARATSVERCAFASVSGSEPMEAFLAECSCEPKHISTGLSLPLASNAVPTVATDSAANKPASAAAAMPAPAAQQVARPLHSAKLSLKKPLLLTPPSSMALTKRLDLASIGSAPTLAAAAAVGNALRPLGRPQRRPLSLGRWRHTDTRIAEKRQSLSERASLANLGFGHRHRSSPHDDSKQRNSSSDRTGLGFGRRSVSLGRPSLSLSLSLSLSASHSHTKEAEKRRMDAWTEDDDEFSIDEYDLSGAYFELPTIDVKGVSFSTSGASKRQAAMNATVGNGRGVAGKGPAADGIGRGSRLSSTSTVVDECELSAEQCKRVYISSMRKLQWHSGRGRYGMNSVLHIKNVMMRANEGYVVVSGGRSLDAHQLSREMLAGFYMLGAGGGGDGRGTNVSSRSLFSTERRIYSSVSSMSLGRRARNGAAYPARSRSMDSMYQEQPPHRARPVVTVAFPSMSIADGRDCDDGDNGKGVDSSDGDGNGDAGQSRFVTAPMSSPPAPAEGAASIADRVLAEVFDSALGHIEPISDSELLGFGSGDLVPLTPKDGDYAEGDRAGAYRSYRRRRNGAGRKWRLMGSRLPHSVATAGPEPLAVVAAM